uniref:tRNA (cytosine(38)-C(5))-methyltransferase n=1 Tax=Anisakis simplex TaxID=6269 RepID=A0A0M3JYH6_ANISI
LQLGIPNSRPRYYLLAKYRPNEPDRVYAPNSISYEFPESSSISFDQPPRCIGDYVNDENDSDASLRVDMTNCCRYMKSIDIVSKSSHRSSCFTKSYSSYITSSGPILLCNPEYQVENPKTLDVVVKICELEPNDANFAKMCSQNTLRLRYFSWREMASLMGFPFSFIKPDQVTQKQMYRALGNSVNVKVLTALLKYLLS